MPGRLLYLIGPSGAGKDCLLRWVRDRDRFGRRLCIARRVITRPADRGDEGHEAIDPASFLEQEAAGDFALTWRAHGCAYAIRSEVDRDLRAGHAVAVCGSRAATARVLRRYPDARVVLVTASRETLARRLAQRGRDDEAAIAERLARADQTDLAPRPGWMVVANDGDLADAGRVLERIAATCIAGPPLACA